MKKISMNVYTKRTISQVFELLNKRGFRQYISLDIETQNKASFSDYIVCRVFSHYQLFAQLL